MIGFNNINKFMFIYNIKFIYRFLHYILIFDT